MEEIGIAGLVQLDGASMAAVSGGEIIPTTSTSIWYDVFWGLGYAYRQTCEGIAAFMSGAGAGGYAYAKVGTY